MDESESYDDSYGQYDDQYMADASGTGQQINPGDADKGRRQLTCLTFLQQRISKKKTYWKLSFFMTRLVSLTDPFTP